MIARLERQAAAELEPPVEGLHQHVRDADSAHIDETSWKQGRAKAWLRVVVTRRVTVFAIAISRGAEVARDLLGTDRRKVVISDRFKSYTWIERRQFCWAHLNRDLQAMIDRGGESAEVGRRLLTHSEQVFDWWHRVRDGTMARATFQSHVAILRFLFRADLRRGAACGCAETAATCRELLAGETHLWTFVRMRLLGRRPRYQEGPPRGPVTSGGPLRRRRDQKTTALRLITGSAPRRRHSPGDRGHPT